jgi:hypothetical protein
MTYSVLHRDVDDRNPDRVAAANIAFGLRRSALKLRQQTERLNWMLHRPVDLYILTDN